MTAEEVKAGQARDPRGAGSGENAVAQRSRHSKDDPAQANDLNKLVQEEAEKAVKNNQKFADDTEKELEKTAPEQIEPIEVTEYPEGNADAGALPIETAVTSGLIAQRDRRAYLIRQAERNEAANDQLNAIQVAQNRRVAELPALLSDPDYLRETSMQTAQAALMTHDPENVRQQREQAAELQKRRTAQAEKENKDNRAVGDRTAAAR